MLDMKLEWDKFAGEGAFTPSQHPFNQRQGTYP